MKETRSNFAIRCAAAKRLLMWHALAKPLGLILVTEFPKSGGTWFCQLIGESCQIPFPRNQAPPFQQCVMHGHHLYRKQFGPTIAIVRDGRDVMVSAYHHFMIGVDIIPPRVVNRFRSRLLMDDYYDVKGNLPAFIEFMFEEFSKGIWHFSWSEFVSSVVDQPNVCLIKYEDMLRAPVDQLEAAIRFLEWPVPDRYRLQEAVDKFSFKNQSKRDPGQESKTSFLRKGIAGDWKNVFSSEARDVFKRYGAYELIKAGYERDDQW